MNLRVTNLKKNPNGNYSFSLGLGAFTVQGFWYNPDKNNIVGPKALGRAIVTAPGAHVKLLRNVVRSMVRGGITSFNTDADFTRMPADQQVSDDGPILTEN